MPTSERDSERADERTAASPGSGSTATEAIRDRDPEATIDRPDRDGYEEIYVMAEPDPETERYRVFVLTATGHLHHVGAFDLALLAREESGPETVLGVLANEGSAVSESRDERCFDGIHASEGGAVVREAPRSSRDDETAEPSRTMSE